MDARKAHPLDRAVDRDVDVAVGTDRKFVLADLIALGQIGIEIVLARQNARSSNLTTSGEAGAYGELNDSLVQYRQDAGKPRADRTGVLIRCLAKFSRATAENLRVGKQLGVDLQSDDGLVVHELSQFSHFIYTIY